MITHENTDVIVIGAGIMGLSVAWQLAELDREVTVLDQFAPGHGHGSSHGGTRGHRYSYEDPVYARMAMDAELWWRTIERRSGETLLTMTGGVDIGASGSKSFERTVATVKDLGLEHTLVESGSRAAATLSPFELPAGTAALLQPGAGLISAARAVSVFEAAARDASVSFVTSCTVLAVNPDGPDGAVVLFERDGQQFAFHARDVVVAAGPWVSQLAARSPDLRLPDPFPVQILACEPVYLANTGRVPETLFYLHPDTTFGDGVYGQSQAVAGDSGRLKLGVHGGVPVARPGEPEGAAALEDSARLRDRLAQFLPDAGGARVDGRDRCYYSMTADEKFIIDRAPGCPAVMIAAGFSGHGFKFAPLIGRAVAESVVDGQTDTDISEMGLSRFGV